MATIELDPLFMKALKLLQSKAKDSGSQLKAMLDDAIAQRKGLKLPSQSGDHEKSSLSKAKSDGDLKRKDGEKRPLDKSVKDPFEPDVKRSKFEQSKQKEKESKEKEREKLKKEKEKKEKEEAQRQKEKAEKERKEKELAAKQESEIPSDDEEPSQEMDAGDFAIDLGIACVVCRQFDVSSGNQLVECQECHSLYHQECHKPTVTGQDVSDPRFVWYCSRCTKSFKKMMTQKPVKPPKPSLPLSSTSKETTSTIAKTNKSESDSGSQAFRRIDPKTIVTPKDPSSLMSSSKAMVGLAGLAANLTKPRGESKAGPVSKKNDSKGDAVKLSKGDGSKSSSKSDTKSTASKQDSSTKQSPSSSKSDARKSDATKSSSSKEESKEGKKSSESKSKSDDRRTSESSSRKEDKKDKLESSSKSSSKEDKKSDKSSPSSNTSSPPTTPVSPGGSADAGLGKSSSSSGGGGSSNKQAVANLSMVTANKRIQMMKKKAQAQTKPQEKRVHIR